MAASALASDSELDISDTNAPDSSSTAPDILLRTALLVGILGVTVGALGWHLRLLRRSARPPGCHQ